MSLAELKSELQKLGPAELSQVEQLLAELRAEASPSGTPLERFLGMGRGMMTLHPGWDEDEPAETWEVLRDDSSL